MLEKTKEEVKKKFLKLKENNDKIKLLFEGNNLEFPSRSEADLSFMSILVWNDFDKEEIFYIFSHSKRSKFFEKLNTTYFDDMYNKIWSSILDIDVEFSNEEEDEIHHNYFVLELLKQAFKNVKKKLISDMTDEERFDVLMDLQLTQEQNGGGR